MTHQPADPWASLCLFLAAYTVKTSAHLASEALVFLFPAARVAHTLPWIAAYGHSLFFRPHSPPLFPHPLTHWRKAWVPSVVERLLLAFQAAIFLFTDFFFFLNINTKHGLTYAILVSLTGSLSYCFTSPVYITLHMDHGSTLLQEE